VRRAIGAQVRDALQDLSPKQREVMRLRFGLDGGAPLTVPQAALRLGTSRDRIRQLENAARRKVRRFQKPRELLSSLN
jgi:RNA polymerase primary sigma factor